MPPEEVAFSLHYKWNPRKPAYVRDARTGDELDLYDFETKVAIYEDRVKTWFLDHAKILHTQGNAGYVVLQIAVSQIEGMEQLRQGNTSRGKSEDYFVKSMTRIFPHLANDDSLLKAVYSNVRCGLFHSGFTQGPVFISEDFSSAIAVDDGRINVCPSKVLASVSDSFEDLVHLLMDPNETTLRRNFGVMWDKWWAASKKQALADWAARNI